MASTKTTETEDSNVVAITTASTDDEYILKLTRTYDFEGEKISEIDFSGLEDVTAATMIKANKTLTTSGDVSILPENSLHYALIIAAGCTAYPIEFYQQLKPKDAIKVKNKVSGFFFGEESD